jgi:hypothetical protein
MIEDNREINEIYSQKVRAGKRKYFFDIKATRSNDYFLTITEKKQYTEEGKKPEKHKIFIYKEDLNKFLEALNQTANHLKKELMPDYNFDQFKDAEYEEDNSN